MPGSCLLCVADAAAIRGRTVLRVAMLEGVAVLCLVAGLLLVLLE